MNYIYDTNEIVYVPKLEMYGKIIDVDVDYNDNTVYIVVFDNGTWDTFLGYQIQGDGLYVL